MLAHSPGWISLLMAAAVYLSGFWTCGEGRAGRCIPGQLPKAGEENGCVGIRVTTEPATSRVFYPLTFDPPHSAPKLSWVLGGLEGSFLPCGQPVLEVSALEAQTLLFFVRFVIPLLAAICHVDMATSGYILESWKQREYGRKTSQIKKW